MGLRTKPANPSTWGLGIGIGKSDCKQQENFTLNQEFWMEPSASSSWPAEPWTRKPIWSGAQCRESSGSEPRGTHPQPSERMRKTVDSKVLAGDHVCVSRCSLEESLEVSFAPNHWHQIHETTKIQLRKFEDQMGFIQQFVNQAAVPSSSRKKLP